MTKKNIILKLLRLRVVPFIALKMTRITSLCPLPTKKLNIVKLIICEAF